MKQQGHPQLSCQATKTMMEVFFLHNPKAHIHSTSDVAPQSHRQQNIGRYYGWPGVANISLFNFYSLPQHTSSLKILILCHFFSFTSSHKFNIILFKVVELSDNDRGPHAKCLRCANVCNGGLQPNFSLRFGGMREFGTQEFDPANAGDCRLLKQM
jgi:hypothetical protein